MKKYVHVGDVMKTVHQVGKEDIAAFHGEQVHEVCSTFVIGREAEWSCRQFVLKMKEDHEEGIGTSLTIEHVSPAFVGENMVFEATLESINGNEILCSYLAKVDNRLIAKGKSGQKLLPKSKIAEIFSNFG